MEPTRAEAAALLSVSDCADWAGLAGVAVDATTPRGAFFAHYGLTGAEHPRTLAVLGDAEYWAILILLCAGFGASRVAFRRLEEQD